MSSALIPGSFDPITVGHLDVITRAAAHFDRVIVAVMNNDMQKYVQGAAVKTYRFTTEERLAMARAACGHLPNAEVITAGGIYATVKEVKETNLLIEVDSNVTLRIEKNMVVADPSAQKNEEKK